MNGDDDDNGSSNSNNRPNKKAKVIDDDDDVNGNDDDDDDNNHDLCQRAWLRWQNYLESCGNEDDEGVCTTDDDDDLGDTDELVELLELLEQSEENAENNVNNNKKVLFKGIDKVRSCQDMLPVLTSVASTILADEAIQKYLVLCSSSSSSSSTSSSSSDNEEEANENDTEEMREELIQQIRTYLIKAVDNFDMNAAAWSMAANFARLLLASSTKPNYANKTNNPSASSNLIKYYLHAANCAKQVRHDTIQILDNDEDSSLPEVVKEWMESLFLHQVTGVELLLDSDGNDDDDDEEIECNDDDDNDNCYWSASAVESTARFMAVMLMFASASSASQNSTTTSTTSKKEYYYDRAITEMENHFDCTHCIHLNVWDNNNNNNHNVTTTTTTTSSNDNKEQQNDDYDSKIHLFTGKGDGTDNNNKSNNSSSSGSSSGGGGILPEPLYQRLCQVFAPDSPYWIQSSYEQRGYFSFFMDYNNNNNNKEKEKNKKEDNNLIRQMIEDHLLPILRDKYPEEASKICGFEWWVHTRPMSASLGHNLHFDTYEGLLKQYANKEETLSEEEKKVASSAAITHPLFSSVMYLTGGGSSSGGVGGGPTIVFNQTPGSNQVATKCYKNNKPRDNSFLIFPGNLLHGVLPCSPNDETDKNNEQQKEESDDAAAPSMLNLLDGLEQQGQKESSPSPTQTPKHRLTLLIGFWSRRVPDQLDIQEGQYYCPCGPVPPATDDEHSWARLLQQQEGEEEELTAETLKRCPYQINPVPVVEPAWQTLNPKKSSDNSNSSTTSPPLEIPHAMDHRFFVKDAPHCFRQSLFEDKNE